MAREYAWEVRDRAEELYVVDGKTYEETAATTGVSATQIQRWAVEDAWQEKRRDLRQALGAKRRDRIMLQCNMMKKALTSLDPQDVYAVVRLEALMNRRPSPDPEQLLDARVIKTPQEAIEVLEESVYRKLVKTLARPDELNMAFVKDLKQALDLVAGMKAKYAVPDEAAAPPQEYDRQRLVAEVDRLLGIE